jgi:hypothetical protein
VIKSISLLTRKAGMTHEQFDRDAMARAVATPQAKALVEEKVIV